MGKVSALYEIVNSESGKKYVGSSCDVRSRLRKHRRKLNKGDHVNSHLQRAWQKYGAEAFSFDVLGQFDPADLLVREQAVFDKHLEADNWDQLYNICKQAGSGPAMRGKDNPWYGRGKDHPFYGKSRPQEHCEAISEGKKNAPHPLRGQKLPKDHWLIQSDNHTKEWREKMSQIMSGEGNPMYGKTGEDAPMYGVRGEDHPRYGKSFTAEQRARRSKALSGENNPFHGKSHSEERVTESSTEDRWRE